MLVNEMSNKDYLQLLLAEIKEVKATTRSNQDRMLDIDVRSRANETRLKIILASIPPIGILGLNILCENSMASNILKTLGGLFK